MRMEKERVSAMEASVVGPIEGREGTGMTQITPAPTTGAAPGGGSAAPHPGPPVAEASEAGRHGAAEAAAPPRRHISFSGKLLFLVIAHVLLAAGVAGIAAAILPAPVVVFGAAALAGILAALVSVRRLSRSAMRSIDALEDGVRSLRDGDFQ